MSCSPTNGAGIVGGAAAGGGSTGFSSRRFSRTTTDATVQSISVAQLINNAPGNGVKLQASLFALGNPITGPDQLAYDFWAFAARFGAGSGAVQYGDITSGVGLFVVPSCTTSGAHVVLINFGGIVGLTIDWLITVQIQSLRGAIIL